LLAVPVHYRDRRTDGIVEKVLAKIPRKEIFKQTGIQFMQLNTIFQLAAMKELDYPPLQYAEALLLTSDLLGYFLTGHKVAEFTNATTTQIFDPTAGDWARPLIRKLELPERIFMPVVQPGTPLGRLLPSVSEELNGLQTTVISSATHDTACAVAATPAKCKHFAYVSCGTWSLVGTEVTAPVLTDAAHDLNFTNEGGVAGTYRLLKNIMGLWLLQESKREWERAGRSFTWPQLTEMTAQAPALVSFVDPDDQRFLMHGDMPSRIRDFCKQHQQPVPQSDGALLRCVTESLALKYRWALERIEELTGHKLEALHMVGGGIQNELLCQWAADASGRLVIAGPIEASAIGNLVVQLITAREASSLAQAREIVASSFGTKTYEPAGTAPWNEAYERFLRILK
jgi:rhamnulokinase